MSARRFAVAVAVLALGAAPARAQVLYKWIDSSGKVVYSDRLPPKDFRGKVERIEPDTPEKKLPELAPGAPRSPVYEPPKAPEAAPPPVDINARRRANRETLTARLDAAREKVDAARKALEEGREMQPEDRRIIQRRVENGAAANAAMSTCRQEKSILDGKVTTVCPTAIANEEYNARVEKLEAAVKQAEADLEEAERAYRRGVD